MADLPFEKVKCTAFLATGVGNELFNVLVMANVLEGGGTVTFDLLKLVLN